MLQFDMKQMIHDVDICNDKGIIITFHHVIDGYNVIMFKPDVVGVDEI